MTAGLRAHAAHWHRFGRIPRKCASMVGSGLTAVDWASGRTPQTRRVSSGTTDCAALWMARLDIVGVITLGMATAIGGGIIRDLLIGAATSHVQRLALLDDGHHGRADRGRAAQVAASADPAAHCARRRGAQPVPGDPGEQRPPTTDSARPKRSSWVTGAGAGTVRDVLARRIPVVLQSGPDAISAIIGAGITVAAILGGAHGVAAAVSAATVCFLVRMLGVA
jgi:hypothetical protein